MANKNIVKGDIGNALHSVAPDHIVTTSDEVFDETLQMYQNEINFLDGVFDISAYNLTDGQPTKYADLTAALGTNGANVPTQYRVPGMTVRYVQSSDNKYVQYWLMSDTFNTTPSNWQGVDDVLKAGSDNLAKSGVVKSAIGNLRNTVASEAGVRYENHIKANFKAGDIIGICIEGELTSSSQIFVRNHEDVNLITNPVINRVYQITLSNDTSEIYVVTNSPTYTGNVTLVVNTGIYNELKTIINETEHTLNNSIQALGQTLSKELYPIINWESGYILYTNGTKQSSDTYKCSNFIPVKPGLNYNCNIQLTGNAGIVFYDYNKQFISGINTVIDNTVTIPADAYYVRLSSPVASYENAYFKADRYIELLDCHDKTEILKQFQNLVWEDGYIYHTNGQLLPSSTYKSTNYIPVIPENEYNINADIAGNAGIAFYDYNKQFISGLSAITNNVVIIPADAYYIRFCTKGSIAQAYFFDSSFLNSYSTKGDIKRSEKDLLNSLFNLIWSSGYINKDNGNVVESNAWYCSDYVPVSPNEAYITNALMGGGVAAIGFYNKDKDFISGVNTSSFTTPSGCCYVRISNMGNSTAASRVILYHNNFNNSKQFLTNADKLKMICQKLVWDDGYIYYTQGSVISSTAYVCSNFIPVIGGKAYYVNCNLPGSNAGIAFYDYDKQFISGVNTIENNTVVVPADAYFARLSNLKSGNPISNIVFYPLDGNITELFVTRAETHNQKSSIIIKNNNIEELKKLPSNAEILDASGNEVDLATYYGQSNYVLCIPISYINADNMVIRFRVKFNEDLNKRNGNIDYDAENPNLLNFFSMVCGTHKINLGVLPDGFINPIPKSGYEAYGQCIGLQGTTKIKAVNADNQVNDGRELVFDNYRFKPLTGGRLFSIRWVDNTQEYADMCMSNDGNYLRFYHSSDNSIVSQYNLSNYDTLTALYEALEEDSHLEVKLYQVVRKTPADMIEFSGIKLVSQREVADGAGYIGVTYPTKIVYDNAPVYVLDKIDDSWHTVEIAATSKLNSGVYCCCVDGAYLYAGRNPERLSYYSGNFNLYFGGEAGGTNINCSIKDIEIKCDELEDTELVTYANGAKAEVISNWHPKVYVLEGHSYIENIPDITEGATQTVHTYDRMELIFRTLEEKGYVSITLTDLQKYVKENIVPHKRMYFAIYDDFQYEIYLNHRLNNIHKRHNVYPALAEITRQDYWDYNGIRYQVSDVNDWMIRDEWRPFTHTRHQDHNILGYLDLIDAFENDIKDSRDYHIPQVGLVWPGGQANIMCLELVRELGWSMAFDIYRNGDIQSVYNGIKRCDNEMMLPRFVVSNSVGLGTLLKEIL